MEIPKQVEQLMHPFVERVNTEHSYLPSNNFDQKSKKSSQKTSSCPFMDNVLTNPDL